MSLFDKNQAFNSIYKQIIIIVIAFLIMGISGFIFVRQTENRHLEKDAENALTFTVSELNANFLEPETLLSGYSELLKNMLLRGDNENTMTSYIKTLNDFMQRDKEIITGFNIINAYFFKWGGKYISGLIQNLNEEFILEDHLWYEPALKAKGKTVISGPFRYKNFASPFLTFSKLIYDNDSEPLAIICLDVELNRFIEHSNIRITEDSYGILLNDKLEIIAHPDRNLIGSKLYRVRSEFAIISNELEEGKNVNNRRIKNMFNDSIVYFIKVKYDWFLGIIIPANEYYRNLTYLGVLLLILGTILACGISVMMYFIARAKMNSDIRTQQKSNFLATMSHEIRTPLNAILGMTEIQIQSAIHPPATSEAFIKINNSGKLLLNIINDILDLSKIEAGKLELVPVKYEAANLINDIIQLNYIRYESKPIEFKVEIDENIPAVLIGDDLRIKQILNNILSNAFKYTDSGEVKLSVYAECVGRGGGVIVTLIFNVTDTGQGMTPEQVSKLFDEYTRFNMEANRTTEGAGLGMTITKNLINLMYGRIQVKSTINEGTSVTIRLPQKTDGVGISGVLGKQMTENLKHFKQDNAIQFKKIKLEHDYMPYGQILIVDDVETNLYVAKGLMAPYGLKIDLATSGFEAIDKIKINNNYDIVFMDHMMPKMDGIETTKLIRGMGYNRPVVALTANAIAGQIDLFLQNGFDDFISKPIDLRKLNIILNRLIRDKQPKEVIDAAQKEKTEIEKKSGHNHGYAEVNSQLAQVFARDAEKALSAINNSINNNLNSEDDIQMYIINVHAMKSALANIGEKELSIKALRLEQAGRDNNFNVIHTETGEFVDLLNKVVKNLKTKNSNNENIKDTEENLIIFKEKIEVIKIACAALDKKTAKDALNFLREKSWSANINELLNKIAEHLLHSEFDETLTLIESIKK